MVTLFLEKNEALCESTLWLESAKYGNKLSGEGFVHWVPRDSLSTIGYQIFVCNSHMQKCPSFSSSNPQFQHLFKI